MAGGIFLFVLVFGFVLLLDWLFIGELTPFINSLSPFKSTEVTLVWYFMLFCGVGFFGSEVYSIITTDNAPNYILIVSLALIPVGYILCKFIDN